jgi:hypothetical protein
LTDTQSLVMKPISPDTSPEAQQVLFELTRRTPVWKRLRLTCDLVQAGRALMLADLRRRFPHANEEELRRRFIARVLTRDEIVRAFGFDPVEEGF